MTRRLLVVLAAIGLALLALVAGVPRTSVALAAPLGPVATPSTGGSSVTVPAPAGGTVTVAQTTGLYNQVVDVSWTGFKKSTTAYVGPTTEFPVRVYECRGADPTSTAACYGSSGYTYPGQTDPTANLPDGPANYVDNVTAKNGTGQAQIEVFTGTQSTTLGCSNTSVCSLVVIPNYGNGVSALNILYATGGENFDKPWAWKNHVTVPLTFAASAANCPLGIRQVNVTGAPQDLRAMRAWQSSTCFASTPLSITYTALEEPQARSEFLSDGADVGLTSEPADNVPPSARRYTYAPVTISGIAIGFHVDDAVTGQPITTMNLNARLVAKILTESYGQTGYVAKGQPVGTGNPATAGNPFSLYSDPEFLALNPGHHWPADDTNPLIMSGNTDVIEEITGWVEADPIARAFLSGALDPWGMHVNTNYLHVAWPTESLILSDPYSDLSHTFVPVDGLDQVAADLVVNQPSSAETQPPYSKLSQQSPGHQALLGFVDTADAAAFQLPTANLVNAAGAEVGPTVDSMSAAVADMTVNTDGITRSSAFQAADPAAYPLTMVQYGMVPTSGASAATISAVNDFLAYDAGAGQVSGNAVGQLPTGYVPLPASMVGQVKSAETAVANQVGNVTTTTSTAGSSAPTASTSSSTTGVTTGDPTGADALGGSTTGADGIGAGSVALPSVAPGGGLTQSGGGSVATVVTRETAASSSTAVGTALPLLIAVAAAAVIAGPVLLLVGTGRDERLRRLLSRRGLSTLLRRGATP